jgi:hypothetical protein
MLISQVLVHVSTVLELQLETIFVLHDVEVKTYTKFLHRARLLTRFPASSSFFQPDPFVGCFSYVLLDMAKIWMFVIEACSRTTKSTFLALSEEDDHTPELANKCLGFFIQRL